MACELAGGKASITRRASASSPRRGPRAWPSPVSARPGLSLMVAHRPGRLRRATNGGIGSEHVIRNVGRHRACPLRVHTSAEARHDARAMHRRERPKKFAAGPASREARPPRRARRSEPLLLLGVPAGPLGEDRFELQDDPVGLGTAIAVSGLLNQNGQVFRHSKRDPDVAFLRSLGHVPSVGDPMRTGYFVRCVK